MLISPKRGSGSGKPRRRRSLNVTLIKRIVVLCVGVITAFGSAVTGLGAQVAFSPMLTWMLGFKTDKAQALGLIFAFLATVAGLIGAIVGHAIPDAFWLRGVALFLGALVGALIAGRFVPRVPSIAWRRWSLTFGIALCVFVVARIGRLSIFDTPEFARWRSVPELGLLAIGVGAASRALGLPSGLLMVPVLYLCGGFTPSEAISLSLLVMSLASLLPAIGYSLGDLVDRNYRWVVVAAALIGGGIGGRLLPPDHAHALFSHRLLIGISAAVAMFLCARELARLNMGSVDAAGADAD